MSDKWHPTIPYAFQYEDVKKVHEKFNGRAVIAWSMGLGKSFGSLIYARQFLKTPGPVVIVCPKNLKENWRRECWKHCHIRATVLDGTARPGASLPPCTDEVYILNYDVLGHVKPAGHCDRTPCWGNLLLDLKPALLIVDEIHYVKNAAARRTRNIRELSRGVPHILGLGGTAGMNQRPAELFPFLNMVRPDLFNSAWAFYSKFCDLKKTPWAWEAKGATNLNVLHPLLLNTCVVRRRKEDVLTDLPPVTTTVIPIDLPPAARKTYQEAAADYVMWLSKTQGSLAARRAADAESLSRMTGLLMLVANLKFETGAVTEWITDVIEEGEKVLAFGGHREFLANLTGHFGKAAVLVNGTVAQKDRQARTDRFNEDPDCKVFVGHWDAAGVGWSCRSASTVAFVELPWTPGQVSQCIDRVRGIGRGTGKPTSAYFLVARDTIEEWLCNLLSEKEKTLNLILDGKAGADVSVMNRLREMLVESSNPGANPPGEAKTPKSKKAKSPTRPTSPSHQDSKRRSRP